MSEVLECEDCGGGPIEAFNRCGSCNTARRKAERDSKKVKVIHPVKKVSEKKAKAITEYSKLKKQFLETNMACQIRLPGCFLSSFDVHHCSKSELNYLNTNTWMAVCRNCHRKIETEMPAEERRERNLLTD